MANTRLSDLAAGSAILSTDLFYGVETAGVGGVQKTGAQLIELVVDEVAGALVAGPNLDIVYDDGAGTITISIDEAALFTDVPDAISIAGTADASLTLDKNAASDDGFVEFQTNASGRARIGCIGDDDLRFQVSPDNFSTTYNAVFVDKDNGFFGVNTSPAARFHVSLGSAEQIRHVWSAGSSGSTYWQNLAGATDQSTFSFNCRGNGESRVIMQAGADDFSFVRNIQTWNHSGGIEIGSPTGGDQGAGTINAQGVYDDGSLLTCYALARAIDGSISLLEWDRRVPSRRVQPIGPDGNPSGPPTVIPRQHGGARRFNRLVQSNPGLMTLQGFSDYWRANRHLPSFPDPDTYDGGAAPLSLGEWVQRTVESADITAVLLDEANETIKAQQLLIDDLEARLSAVEAALP